MNSYRLSVRVNPVKFAQVCQHLDLNGSSLTYASSVLVTLLDVFHDSIGLDLETMTVDEAINYIQKRFGTTGKLSTEKLKKQLAAANTLKPTKSTDPTPTNIQDAIEVFEKSQTNTNVPSE